MYCKHFIDIRIHVRNTTADDEVAPEWTINFTVKFLFPL